MQTLTGLKANLVRCRFTAVHDVLEHVPWLLCCVTRSLAGVCCRSVAACGMARGNVFHIYLLSSFT